MSEIPSEGNTGRSAKQRDSTTFESGKNFVARKPKTSLKNSDTGFMEQMQNRIKKNDSLKTKKSSGKYSTKMSLNSFKYKKA
jgi:hypothetical protein